MIHQINFKMVKTLYYKITEIDIDKKVKILKKVINEL